MQRQLAAVAVFSFYLTITAMGPVIGAPVGQPAIRTSPAARGTAPAAKPDFPAVTRQMLDKFRDQGLEVRNAADFQHLPSMTHGIQEAVDSLPRGSGGLVFIEGGVHELYASISLSSNVTLTGSGPQTVLKPVDETVSHLASPVSPGQATVAVDDASGFFAGMEVIIHIPGVPGPPGNELRTITLIEGNSITLNSPLANSYPFGLVVNAFPIVKSDGFSVGMDYSNVVVQNLKIDGNGDNGKVNPYAQFQAGVLFSHTSQSVIRDVWIVNSAYDGISDQGSGITENRIVGNRVEDCKMNGIHLGSNNRYAVVAENTVLRSGGDGLFFCVWVRDSVIAYNVISDGYSSGIGGIGPAEVDNLIVGNIITGNAGHGIQAAESGTPGHPNHFVGNVIIGNGTASDAQTVFSGIQLTNISDPWFIDGNLICGNIGYGIELIGASPSLTGNTIADNGRPFIGGGGGIRLEDASPAITYAVIWNNQPFQIGSDGASAPQVNWSDVQGGYGGTGNMDADPLFTTSGTNGYFLRTDSPCVDAGDLPPGSVTMEGFDGPVSLDQLTTSTDFSADGSANVDLGYHYDPGRTNTLSAEITCLPAAGTLPFDTLFTVRLGNTYPAQTRKLAARIDVNLANGAVLMNWKNGYTNIRPGGSYTTSWQQPIPALLSVIGENSFDLLATDITPPPYNQPPYAAAGFTDSDSCRVIGIAP